MASSQNGNSSEFRLRAKRILLTYSQVGEQWDHSHVARLIGRLGARGVVCREMHRDGGVHYHALLFFDTTYHTRDVTAFDAGGAHPNIKPIRWTPRKAYDYVCKDGDPVFCNITDDDIDGPGKDQRSAWSDIIASPDRTAFFEAIRSLDPRTLVCSFTSIEKYADWAYRDDPLEYESPVTYAERNDWVGSELSEWFEATLSVGRGTGSGR